MRRIWGLDIGVTSIGWAVIDYDNARETGQILRMGCRIFPEARDPDGTPLNQHRRQKRMMRRQLRRRRERRRALNEYLAEIGLLPPFCSRNAQGKAAETDSWHLLMRSDPIALRKRGLTEMLTPHELGRALYQLAQRRHFKGRDLDDDEDDHEVEAATTGKDKGKRKGKEAKAEETADTGEQSADEKAAKASRDSTLAALKASGETLGEYLAAKAVAHERQRGTHANRATVLNEFERLWDAQAIHRETLRDPAIRERVQEAIFAQRPVFWRKNTLGTCRFMPGEALCPKGSWLSQQRRMLEKLNNLAIVGGNARPLDKEEREAILAILQTQGSMSWGAVRSALKPIYKARGEAGAERSLKFNLELDEKGTLLGNPLEAKLAGIFGDAWANHPHKQAIRDATHQRLWEADYGVVGTQRVVIHPLFERKQRRAAVAERLMADFGITPEQAAALRDLKLPTGWEPFSIAALEQFMPHLETGVRFGALTNGPEWQAWREKAFPERERPTGEILDRLPSPTRKHPEELKRIASLRNPTVVRVQNELRKVVNNLISLHGKPDLIRVELAREVGKSKRERDEMQIGQRRQEKRRKDARADLESKGIKEPSRGDIEKWLLWKECDGFDPYSGDPISFDALFGTPEFDVEHIWPRSKSFDNSFANKTLCRKSYNIRKGNRTPFDAFGKDPEWEEMKDRVWKLVKNGKMNAGKAKRFCREIPLEDDFTTRQLNDTSFAARQTVAFLKRLWPDVGTEAPVNVQVVTGRVTAQLRRFWGLNHILSDDGEKTRADHRHHAIDALVVACTDPGITQRLSRYWQLRDNGTAQQPQLNPPWPTIRPDAEKAAMDIIISHRVRKKVSGPLHKDTVYGDTKRDITTKTGTYRLFVTRKSVSSLSKGEIEDICDDRVREIVARHVAQRGGDPKKAFPPYPTLGPDGPPIQKVRLTIRQQTNLMAPVSTGYADLGSNHHVAIFRQPDGKAAFEVVSLFEAARRLARREPVVSRKQDNGAIFVMSLAPGDTLEYAGGDKKGYWIVQGAWANGQIVIERANDAAHATTTRPAPGALLKDRVRKISVDPIGRVRPAND